MEDGDLEMRVALFEMRVALLTRVVGELLVWVQQAEIGGSVPLGTLERARLLLEVDAIKGKAEAFRVALHSLEGKPLPVIKGNLEGILAELEGQKMKLEEKMGGTDDLHR